MANKSERTSVLDLIHRVGGLQRVTFYATVVTLLGLMWAFLSDTLTFLVTAWFTDEPGVHHLHDLALVAILWTVIVGLAVQLYEPERRVGAIQQALLVNVVITGANALTGFFFPPTLILGGLLVAAFALHPAGRGVLRVRTAGPIDYLLGGLVVLAAVPLAVYAADQYALSASGDVHAQLGHYADMITYVLLILLLGLSAAAKPLGWRVPLWSSAGLAVILGTSSVLHPTLASSAGLLWGGLAVLWGIGLVAAGELRERKTRDHLLRRRPER